MTQSLPAQAPWSPSRKDVIINAAAGVTLRALPRIPDVVKRVMLGWHSITVDGNTLDTTLQLMLAAQRPTGIQGLAAGDDVAGSRARLEILAASFKQHLPVGRVTNLSIPGPAGPIPARHYSPDVAAEGAALSDVAAEAAPMLVFYHGGGQVIGSLNTHDDLCRKICREGAMHVLSVDYRLAPEHKAPAGADDAFAAFLWARDHAADLGADAARVAVGGDSAGGNLAALVAQRARTEAPELPALQLLIYPVTNYRDETRSQTLFAEGYFLTKHDLHWFRSKYLDGSELDAGDPRVSPLLADDLTGLPPALVLTGGFDPLRDEAQQYVDAMRAAGVAVDHRLFGSLVHGWANFFPLGGGSAPATTEMISALRAHLARA